MKSGKKMDSTMLNLITAIDALEKSGNAPHTVEALKKIYWEIYETILRNTSGETVSR